MCVCIHRHIDMRLSKEHSLNANTFSVSNAGNLKRSYDLHVVFFESGLDIGWESLVKLFLKIRKFQAFPYCYSLALRPSESLSLLQDICPFLSVHFAIPSLSTVSNPSQRPPTISNLVFLSFSFLLVCHLTLSLLICCHPFLWYVLTTVTFSF